MIGRIAKRVKAEDYADDVFGYTIANDVTARDLQSSDGQWARAKGFDTFCPLGPVIETELDFGALEITLQVDGEDRTAGQHARHGALDSANSWPTPPRCSPCFPVTSSSPALRRGRGVTDGQVVEITIEGIGTLANPVRNRA